MKLASVSRLSGVRTTSGRPSSRPGDRLAGEVVVGEQAAARRPRRRAPRGTASRRRRRGRAVLRRPRRTARTAPAHAAELARAVVAVHHRDRVAGRGGDQVELVVHLLQRALEHDHGEDAGAGADVAGARRDRVGGDHAGAGVALGRAERDAGPQRAGRVEQRGALRGELARPVARRRAPRAAGRRAPRSARVPRRGGRSAAEQAGVVGRGRRVDREHPGRVADAEHPCAR